MFARRFAGGDSGRRRANDDQSPRERAGHPRGRFVMNAERSSRAGSDASGNIAIGANIAAHDLAALRIQSNAEGTYHQAHGAAHASRLRRGSYAK